MLAFHVSDPETDRLVRQLATRRGLGITEAINLAVRNELAKDGPAKAVPAPRAETDLLAALDREIRAKILDYTRLLAKDRGTRSVGSRVYQMLVRHGPVETLRRLVAKPTEGLIFLRDQNRLELSAEHIVLDLRFLSVIPPEVRAQAEENLRPVQGRGASRR
jgi:antitoxin VapB